VTVRPIDRCIRLVCHGLVVIRSAGHFAFHSHTSNTVTANFNFITDVSSCRMAVPTRAGVLRSGLVSLAEGRKLRLAITRQNRCCRRLALLGRRGPSGGLVQGHFPAAAYAEQRPNGHVAIVFGDDHLPHVGDLFGG
jgi:hypothetical protein